MSLRSGSWSLAMPPTTTFISILPSLIRRRARSGFAALDTIESLEPRAVVATHKRPENDDDPRIIEETRQYIRDFDRLAQTTSTAQELYDQMLALYPSRINPGWALWSSARAAKA